MNLLKENQIYLLKNNEIAFCHTINKKHGWCLCIATCNSSKDCKEILCMTRYYELDGNYSHNDSYDIIKPLTKFTKEYKQNKNKIECLLNYLKKDRDIIERLSIFFIPKEISHDSNTK